MTPHRRFLRSAEGADEKTIFYIREETRIVKGESSYGH